MVRRLEAQRRKGPLTWALAQKSGGVRVSDWKLVKIGPSVCYPLVEMRRNWTAGDVRRAG